MSYVDGYVLPVPKKRVKDYLKLARLGRRVWMKHGALDYKECVADDIHNDCGTVFPKLLKLKPGETVVFAYVVFKSRAHRDHVNAKVMKEMSAMDDMTKQMPFDIKRMSYGGFKAAVE